MAFDVLSCGSGKLCKQIPSCELSFDKQRVLLAFWEEHCVECGAPACYSKCEKYEKGMDGKCRRFKQGVSRVRLPDGAYAYQMSFKEWGKLELQYKNAWINSSSEIWQIRIESVILPFLRTLNKCLPFLPWNRNPLSFFRSIRNRIISFWKNDNLVPATWRGICWAEKDEVLCASIANEKEDIFIKRLELTRGWNKFEMSLPYIPLGSVIRIFPIQGGSGMLCFKELEIVGKKKIEKTEPSKFIKCVAWDLDNTLWNGILAECGSEGVQLRHDVISVIKELDKRGILHTVVSKNDYDVAWGQLEKLGLSEYFIFPQINWEPKSFNVQRAAKAINIGLDTFAFVDDSPYERGEVADKYSCVRIFDEQNIEKLLELECFNPPISSESSNRRFSYLAEMKRCKRQEQIGFDREAFLRDCEIQLTCLCLDTVEIKHRCWELVQRTNQLTLAAHRYTETEFEDFLSKEKYAYAVHCKDRFGEYGIVGFIAVSVKKRCAFVDEFVMSCRVAKKLCEQSTLLFMASVLKQQGIVNMEAKIISTGRNMALIEAFDVMPFTKEEVESNTFRYVLDMSKEISKNVFTNSVRVKKETPL